MYIKSRLTEIDPEYEPYMRERTRTILDHYRRTGELPIPVNKSVPEDKDLPEWGLHCCGICSAHDENTSR